MGKRVAVFGAGAFGTSLAINLSRGNEIVLFSAFEDHVEEMRTTRRNSFLEGFELELEILVDVCSNVSKFQFDYLLWCFPVKPTLEILGDYKEVIPNVPIIICSKGFSENNKFLSDEFYKIIPNKVAIFSGPTFATELARHCPSTAIIASYDFNDAEIYAKDLSTDSLKILPSDDLIGVQVAGAMKNVVAIASGILEGLGAGKNSAAALLTFGVNEMAELGVALGAKSETFMGLAGVGDLILTATSDESRNMRLGMTIASGKTLKEAEEETGALFEGAVSVTHVFEIMSREGLQLKICKKVHDILYKGATPETILDVIK